MAKIGKAGAHKRMDEVRQLKERVTGGTTSQTAP